MINLLPKDTVHQLRASQHNTLLLRYTIFSAFTLGAVILIHLATFTMLKFSEGQSNSIVKDNNKRISKYNETKKIAAEYSENLKVAKSLFDKQFPYTTALLNLASAIPKNVILQDINLAPEIIGRPSTLSARAKSYNDGIALRDSLSSSKIAENVSFVSLIDERDANSNDGNATRSHPFLIVINLTFTKSLIQKSTVKEGR